MKKRVSGLDLLRCLALFSVITFHSFLNNGYYGEAQMGLSMWLAGSGRWFSVCCIGLFLMLTGYLKCQRTDLKSCYRGLIPILLGYFLAAVISVPIRHFLLGDEQSLLTWLRRLFGFSAVYYGWYVEMYVGLTLLSPFVNLLLTRLDTTGKLFSLVTVMLILTALPGATPLALAPDYWRVMYPVTYYILGATVRRLQPRLHPALGILGAAVMAMLLGAATVCSTDGKLSEAFTQEFGDLWITIMVLFLFVGLYRVELHGIAGKVLSFAAGGCYGGYLLSHLLDAWCYKLVAQWHQPEMYLRLFVCVTIPIFVISVLLGNALQRLSVLPLRTRKAVAR